MPRARVKGKALREGLDKGRWTFTHISLVFEFRVYFNNNLPSWLKNTPPFWKGNNTKICLDQGFCSRFLAPVPTCVLIKCIYSAIGHLQNSGPARFHFPLSQRFQTAGLRNCVDHVWGSIRYAAIEIVVREFLF